MKCGGKNNEKNVKVEIILGFEFSRLTFVIIVLLQAQL